jgi:hypothetical protein
MIAGGVMTSRVLPLSGDPFEPPAKAIVDNWLICAAAQNVCFWHKADIAAVVIHVRFWE